jgi:hypothetical protein
MEWRTILLLLVQTYRGFENSSPVQTTKGLGTRSPDQQHPSEAVWQNACAALSAWCAGCPSTEVNLPIDTVPAERRSESFSCSFSQSVYRSIGFLNLLRIHLIMNFNGVNDIALPVRRPASPAWSLSHLGPYPGLARFLMLTWHNQHRRASSHKRLGLVHCTHPLNGVTE